jgi:hypothetical protein
MAVWLLLYFLGIGIAAASSSIGGNSSTGCSKSKQVGVTSPKEDPVEVLEQNDKDVTFEVTNTWEKTVDYLFVQYTHPSTGFPKCEVFTNVTTDFGADIDSGCMKNIPISVVTLVAVSTTGAFTDGDTAALPSCCGGSGVLADLPDTYQSASYTYILDCTPVSLDGY